MSDKDIADKIFDVLYEKQAFRDSLPAHLDMDKFRFLVVHDITTILKEANQQVTVNATAENDTAECVITACAKLGNVSKFETAKNMVTGLVAEAEAYELRISDLERQLEEAMNCIVEAYNHGISRKFVDMADKITKN